MMKTRANLYAFISALHAALLILLLAASPAGSGSMLLMGAGVQRSAAWTPASVTTYFWYDASNLSSITKDGSNNVTQWNDLSGNSRTLTPQTSNAHAPVYTTGTLNSLPGMRFINNNDINTQTALATATFTQAQAFTLVVVLKTTGVTHGVNGSYGDFGIVLDGDITGAASNRLVAFVNRTDVSNHASYYAGSSSIDMGATFSATTGYHYTVTFNNTSSASNLNGTTTSGTSPGSFGIVNGLTIGSLAGTANALDMYVCEMFAMAGSSPTDLANALAYVNAKWGV